MGPFFYNSCELRLLYDTVELSIVNYGEGLGEKDEWSRTTAALWRRLYYTPYL